MTEQSTDHAVSMIWCRVLGIGDGDPRGFYDAGGDSLKAVRLAFEVEDDLGVEVEIGWLFDHPTLEELQALVRACTTGA